MFSPIFFVKCTTSVSLVLIGQTVNLKQPNSHHLSMYLQLVCYRIERYVASFKNRANFTSFLPAYTRVCLYQFEAIRTENRGCIIIGSYRRQVPKSKRIGLCLFLGGVSNSHSRFEATFPPIVRKKSIKKQCAARKTAMPYLDLY